MANIQNYLTQGEAANLRNAALSATENETKKAFVLSELIYQVKNGLVRVRVKEAKDGHMARFILNQTNDIEPWVPVWAGWGYKSWEDYLKEELQISAPTARAHLRVWEVWGIDLKGRWDRTRLLPLSKMYALADVALETKKLNILLDEARHKTLSELRADSPTLKKKRLFKINVSFKKRDLDKYNRLVREIDELHGTTVLRDSLILVALAAYRDIIKTQPWLIGR